MPKRLIDLERNAPSAREDRREQILDAALKVIATGGVDSVTHRRVADAAGVPLGSTTYYFQSRQHLLRDAFEHYLEWSKAALRRLSKSVNIDTVEDFVEFTVAVNERDYSGAPLLLAEYELTLFAARDRDVADLLHEWDEYNVAQFARLLEQLGAHPPFDAARTVLHLIRGYELDRLSYHEPDSENLKRRMQKVVSAFVED